MPDDGFSTAVMALVMMGRGGKEKDWGMREWSYFWGWMVWLVCVQV